MAECAAEGCAEEIEPTKVMCQPHWVQVPKDIRDRIWTSWLRLRGGSCRAVDMAAHNKAKQEAIQSLRTSQPHR